MAQLGDVGERTGVDTPYTPRAKSAPQDPRAGQSVWRYVAGARYRGNPKPADVPAGEARAAPDPAETAAGAGWALPLVVSSTVGGEFAEAGGQGGGGAVDGFWHGYQVVRRDVSGDPGKTIVGQRPVLGWVAIRAQERKLGPGQRMTLRGYGREAYGQDAEIGHLDITCSAQ